VNENLAARLYPDFSGADGVDDADKKFFECIMTYNGHVVQPLPFHHPVIPYSLRERSHNKTFLNKTAHLSDE